MPPIAARMADLTASVIRPIAALLSAEVVDGRPEVIRIRRCTRQTARHKRRAVASRRPRADSVLVAAPAVVTATITEKTPVVA